MEHTICYISKQAENLDDSALHELFRLILEVNPRLKITGTLLHNSNFFLQVLEGDKYTLKELFDNIKKDKRHKDILKVFDEKIENRIFENYEANFSIHQTTNEIKKLNKYLASYKFDDLYPKNIKTLIEPFLL